MPAAQSNSDTKSSDAELEEAIRSAEYAFTQMSLAKDAASKQQWSRRAKAALLRAEQLKAKVSKSPDSITSATPLSGGSSNAILRTPVVTRTLPKAEQILLLKSGFVGGNKYPPWSTNPSASEFELAADASPFRDDAIFSISPSQQKVFDGWKRPAEALQDPTMIHTQPLDLVQDASTDCSVVASLCAGVARQKRGHAKLTSTVIHPWNTETGYPIMSPNGKYVIRLNFNGCFRRVVIDDRLPSSNTDRVIHVIDRQNPGLLWPALIEKAYLKVRGGYDFPGSNSATDLWIVTGWIPEQVFLQSEDLDLDQLWSRVLDDWTQGDVLITMGTGKMSSKVEKEIGLAGEHDYAVLDLQEIEGQRLLLIKNPWCEGTNWHRVPQRSTVIPKPLDRIPDIEAAAAQSPRDLLNADAQLSPGTFWMDLDNAVQYFESIYLNWNPGRFEYRQDLHFSWDLSAATAQHAPLQNQPQFQVSTSAGGRVWLLLSKHFHGSDAGEVGSVASVDLTGFISLAAYAADGKRVKLTGTVIAKSAIIDSPQILLKLDACQPGKLYSVVAAEQELPRRAHTFTISAFGDSALHLDHAAPSHLRSETISASWTRDTAGGNANHLSYGTNPQFSITIKQPSRLSLLLQAQKDELNIHVKLVHGNGKRVRAIRNRDVVLDSGDYRKRVSVAESKSELPAGVYTAICSTFEPQQIGRFELLVEADADLHVVPIARDGAGRLSLLTTAIMPEGSLKIAARIVVQRLVSLSVLARANSRESSSAHLSISIEQGQASSRRIIRSSDDDDLASTQSGSARVDDVDLGPNMLQYGPLWLVITRVCVPERAVRLSLDVEMLVDQPDAIRLDDWISIEE